MTYSYEKLKRDVVDIGLEVAFYYLNEKYWISTNEEGWYLTKIGDEHYQTFSTAEELISKATVNGKLLKEIWGDVEL